MGTYFPFSSYIYILRLISVLSNNFRLRIANFFWLRGRELNTLRRAYETREWPLLYPTTMPYHGSTRSFSIDDAHQLSPPMGRGVDSFARMPLNGGSSISCPGVLDFTKDRNFSLSLSLYNYYMMNLSIYQD